jgi:hypothetical protein
VRWRRNTMRSAASYSVLERAVAAAVASIIEIRVSGCIVLSESIVGMFEDNRSPHKISSAI